MGLPKLLIIDDQLDVRLLLQAYLKKQYDVFLSDGGSDALSLVHKLKPSLILLDQNLEKGTGFELAKQIREKFSVKQIRIFILSGDPSLHHKLNDEGPDLVQGFLLKPISAQRLFDALGTGSELVADPPLPPDFQALLVDFLKNRMSDLEKIQIQIQARNAVATLKSAHSLKGVVRCYGFNLAGDLAQGIEDAVKNGDWEKSEDLQRKLVLHFRDRSTAEQ